MAKRSLQINIKKIKLNVNLSFFNPLMPHFVSDTVEDNIDNAEKDIEEGIEHLEDAKDYQVNLDRYIRMISHPK